MTSGGDMGMAWHVSRVLCGSCAYVSAMPDVAAGRGTRREAHAIKGLGASMGMLPPKSEANRPRANGVAQAFCLHSSADGLSCRWVEVVNTAPRYQRHTSARAAVADRAAALS